MKSSRNLQKNCFDMLSLWKWISKSNVNICVEGSETVKKASRKASIRSE